jgi:methyltransferase (TIGR00027 family)
MADNPVSNVSDTARWVAAYRAAESARKGALFTDPLAGRLAGDQGRAIVAASPRRMRSGWTVVTRTKLIDDLVIASVADGCDRVINLAAGMDTRPYRLPLPASLTWVEADLPAIIDEKERLLVGETPACTLTRECVDLSDAPAREAFLSRAVAPARSALVITEGLLMYLDEPVVRELAIALAAHAGIRWWVLDLFSPGTLEMLKKTRGHFAAPMFHFAPPDGVAFFERLGWRAPDIKSIVREAIRFRRAPLLLRPFALFPDPDPRKPGRNRWYGVARLEARGTP